MPEGEESPLDLSTKPSVVLVIGVNGVGKTTTIGKMAAYLRGRASRCCWRQRIPSVRRQRNSWQSGQTVPGCRADPPRGGQRPRCGGV